MAERRNKLRICLAASAGGHLSQLLKLNESWKSHHTFVVTTNVLMWQKLREHGTVYVVGECNRQHPIRVAQVLRRCIGIMLRERPDAVISTGAAAGCILCFLGKILGAKVIWIDSIANVEQISLSGRMVRYIADLFLVQWPDLVHRYRKVKFSGSLI